jgi:hypothetical protein
VKVHQGEWQLIVQCDEQDRSWVRLQYREHCRDFHLRKGDTLDLQVKDGAIHFKGHNPAPDPEPPIRVELIDMRLK